MALAFFGNGRILAEPEDADRFLLVPDQDSGCPMILVKPVGAGDPDSFGDFRSRLVGVDLGLEGLWLR